VARFVLDTNIISQILRRNAPALARLGEAADHDDDLFMCPVVFYELWRGLSYRGADRQLEELTAFARTLQWIDYDRAMWVEAAGLWADRRRHGRTHDDADLLIAAFSRRLRATLVTNNTADFTDLDVPVVDWTADQPGR
jgi:tRNA(fMet)-specific endonuclease VapC